MKVTEKPHRTSGFTLVEVLVVMVILSVVMMAAMSLFIPAKRAAVVQTDLADVQGNLRFALDRMTQDFRAAGFLTTGAAISGYTPPTPPATASVPTNSLTINTRTISGHYGRIESPPDLPGDPFVLHDSLQVDSFSVGDFVAVMQPVEGTVINNEIYKVNAKNRAARTVTLVDTGGNDLDDTEIQALKGTITGNILLVAPSNVVADINRTITFAHADADGDGVPDTLTRQIDGGRTQFLARNVSAVQFIVEEDGDGDPHKVTIEIEGQTEAIGNEAIGSQKTKRMRTVVSLRNV